MRTDNYIIDIDSRVDSVIDFSIYSKNSSLLIQVFSGVGALGLKRVIGEVKRALPNSHIIGTTTDGEIINSSVGVEKIVISISSFQKTQLKSVSILEGKSSFHLGQEIVKQIVTNRTKLVIMFSDANSINAEELMDGVSSLNPDLMIAGGIAGNNGTFSGITLAHEDLLTLQGVVAVALDSDELQVYNDYNFNWQPIGKEFKVTKAEGNILYELDGENIIDVYAKYFGDEVVAQLPRTGIEFPLVIKRNGVNIARAMLDRNGDESLTFAGNLDIGETAQFGIGNIELILENSIMYSDKLKDRGIESFFIYSCMARRRLMPDHIHLEIEPFSKIAPVSGFFTYGEFFHSNGRNELLNQTMTYISLSESSSNLQKSNFQDSLFQENRRDVNRDSSLNTIKSLIHLVNTTVKELNSTIDELHKVQQDRDEKGKVLEESLEYASYIQRNVIPPDGKIDLFFKNYMVIWEPRDRVGGDIYFFEEFGDEAILILVDAVGHGIPGAFITMSIKAIEQSIVRRCLDIKEKSPAKILEVFDKSMKHLNSGSQIDNNVMGFDGVVLLINKVTKTIKFSGANSKLCQLTKEGEHIRWSGDKFSIGYDRRREREKIFSEIEIDIRDGDRFYVATDGFRDQIGGDRGFPFGRKKCKKLMSQIYNRPFVEQRKEFLDTLREWQKENLQTDDITLIGFEVF